MLKTVTVYGLPEEKYLAGSSLVVLDSSLKSNERSRHLGEVLSMQLPIYFRNYGNGMLSSISMRGTSPQHTAVLWNGLNINSFSLGQADFSILPVAAFDEVKIHEGAGSARFGSGAFGGTVLLNSALRAQGNSAARSSCSLRAARPALRLGDASAWSCYPWTSLFGQLFGLTLCCLGRPFLNCGAALCP